MTVAKYYGNYPLKAISGAVNYPSDTIRCSLLLNTYTPDQDNHVFFSDVSAFEASGGGYAVQTLAGKTASYDGSSNTVTQDCNDISFPGLTLSGVRYAVFYHWTGSGATSVLILYQDFEADQNPSSQAINLTVAGTGLGVATVS